MTDPAPVLACPFPDAYQSDKALDCPFCGAAPFIVPWHGGGPKKRHLMCCNEECPVEPSICAATEAKAIAAWNRRLSDPVVKEK